MGLSIRWPGLAYGPVSRVFNLDPLHLIEAHFVAPPIIEQGGVCDGVVGHRGGILRRPAIFQIRHDPRRPKAMVISVCAGHRGTKVARYSSISSHAECPLPAKCRTPTAVTPTRPDGTPGSASHEALEIHCAKLGGDLATVRMSLPMSVDPASSRDRRVAPGDDVMPTGAKPDRPQTPPPSPPTRGGEKRA
jgi:hypothetical protein